MISTAAICVNEFNLEQIKCVQQHKYGTDHEYSYLMSAIPIPVDDCNNDNISLTTSSLFALLPCAHLYSEQTDLRNFFRLTGVD